MNVTVIVAKPLQPACEGRATIELGVPPASELADILLTLISLYPGLRAFVANENRPLRQHFNVVGAGRKIFLFASTTPPRAHSLL